MSKKITKKERKAEKFCAKNKVRNHIEGLKKFRSPTMLEGVNKLYFLEVTEKEGLVKIGDTHRLVEERNNETILNAALHPSKPVTWVVAKNHNNRSFRDKRFHKFLENKNYERQLNHKGSKSEWFFITLEQALLELEEFTKKPVYTVIELRVAQHYALHLLAEATKDGYKHINFGGCVRIGKTVISLTHSARNKSMPVYIGKNLTSQFSAEKDNDKFNIVSEMLTQSLHGVDESNDNEMSKKTKKIIRNINKANVNNLPVLFFIDEVDDASHTKKSREIITPVVKYFEKKGMLTQVIPMSGTRIYRGEKILADLTDGPIKEISIEYYEMQILEPKTTCERNYTHISFYSADSNGLANISDSLKNTDAGHKSLATIITKLLGTNNFGFKTRKQFPHWFMKFCTVGKNNANVFKDYLNENCNKIGKKKYHYATINGDFTEGKEAEVYCENIIKKNPDKICVFITQGMATTSFSVASIGNSVVFTDNELTADDIQALPRSATWTEGKVDCNMIVVTTNDSDELSFDDPFEDETKIAKNREEKEEIYRELLNNNSMVHIATNGKSVQVVRVTHRNIEKVLDKKAKAMSRIASIMNKLRDDLDEEILEEIWESVSKKKKTSKPSESTKGETFDPFGDNDPSGNKPTVKKPAGKLTDGAKAKILRAFVENAVNVPAVARLEETTIEEFEFWNEIGVSKELFFKVYNSSESFKDRIDAIHNLCSEQRYLIQNYINKLV